MGKAKSEWVIPTLLSSLAVINVFFGNYLILIRLLGDLLELIVVSACNSL